MISIKKHAKIAAAVLTAYPESTSPVIELPHSCWSRCETAIRQLKKAQAMGLACRRESNAQSASIVAR